MAAGTQVCLQQLAPHIPQKLAELMDRCWHGDPEQRPEVRSGRGGEAASWEEDYDGRMERSGEALQIL